MPFSDIPPSYDFSVSREAWSVVAPYIPSADLCSCCLVSRKWHSIFIPFLWGDPASHFGIANDAVYVALTRFKRTFRRARLGVRSLTHTLHLPPALSEIYGGPNTYWLRDVLEYLPNLQSLIVNRLPFFDHHSLAALKVPDNLRGNANEEVVKASEYGLKLLLASGEANTTSLGLSIALPRFPRLVYLDLSYTKPARDASVLLALSSLYELQVLKLRGIGLKDGEAEVLANAIDIRVRLLDIRDNSLTDMAVRSLMQACFLPLTKNPDAAQLDSRRVEDWPVGMAPGPDYFSLDTLRGEELDRELLKQLTNPLTGRLAFEDIPHRGLTHLYISGNQLSVEGLSSLLKSERLHILDGGSVDAVKTIARSRSLTSKTGYVDEIRFPGAEKLIPVLAQSASKNLTYLRTDHALVTAKFDAPGEIAQAKSSTGPAVELPAAVSFAAELPSADRQIVEAPAPTNQPVELPTERDQVFELDTTSPRYELAGDPIHFAISPAVGEAPDHSFQDDERSEPEPIRGVGPYAPEVVTNQEDVSEHEVEDFYDPSSGTWMTAKVSDESSSPRSDHSPFSPISPVTPAVRRAFTFRTLLAKQKPSPLAEPPMTLSRVPSSSEQQVQPDSSKIPVANANSSTSFGQTPTRMNTAKSNYINTQIGSASTASQTLPPRQRQHRIEMLLAKRPHPLDSPLSSNLRNPKLSTSAASTLSLFHPCLLPNLRTLVLTKVPTTVPQSSDILSSLKSFVSACAEESMLSYLLAKTDYSLPPGRARHHAEQVAARRIFALRTIVLELETQIPTNNGNPRRPWEHSRQRFSMSKSSTGDHDSENLWSAAENDFSFFGEEGEQKDECGIYEHDPEKYFPTAHMDDKIFLTADDASDRWSNHSGNSPRGSFSSERLSMIPNRANSLLSPRNLPLGRNRRSSNEAQRNQADVRAAISAELPGTIPTSHPLPPPQRSVPAKQEEPEVMLDLVSELASWRRERKKAYEDEMAKYHIKRRTSLHNHHPSFGTGNDFGTMQSTYTGTSTPTDSANPEQEPEMPFVEGHWKGEIKVVRNSNPKGRSGIVDVYGNYFEKGYLYP